MGEKEKKMYENGKRTGNLKPEPLEPFSSNPEPEPLELFFREPQQDPRLSVQKSSEMRKPLLGESVWDPNPQTQGKNTNNNTAKSVDFLCFAVILAIFGKDEKVSTQGVSMIRVISENFY